MRLRRLPDRRVGSCGSLARRGPKRAAQPRGRTPHRMCGSRGSPRPASRPHTRRRRPLADDRLVDHMRVAERHHVSAVVQSDVAARWISAMRRSRRRRGQATSGWTTADTWWRSATRMWSTTRSSARGPTPPSMRPGHWARRSARPARTMRRSAARLSGAFGPSPGRSPRHERAIGTASTASAPGVAGGGAGSGRGGWLRLGFQPSGSFLERDGQSGGRRRVPGQSYQR